MNFDENVSRSTKILKDAGFPTLRGFMSPTQNEFQISGTDDAEITRAVRFMSEQPGVEEVDRFADGDEIVAFITLPIGN